MSTARIPHPLDGAWLKVVRAKQHLKSLNEEIEGYLSGKPYEIDAERQGNVVRGSAVFKVQPPAGTCALTRRGYDARAAPGAALPRLHSSLSTRSYTSRGQE